jgi:hypothetical protein
VLLALAACVVLAPGRAQAGCSQHVVSRMGALVGIAHLEILNAADDGTSPSLPAPGPCRGPFCKNRTPLPTPAPLAVEASRIDVWGLPPNPVILSRPAEDTIAPRADSARVVVWSDPIQRPPR